MRGKGVTGKAPSEGDLKAKETGYWDLAVLAGGAEIGSSQHRQKGGSET